MNLSDYPHKRYNPLTGEWVLVSPHRAKRPWQGKVEDAMPDDRPAYDPKCYLCPRNQRAEEHQNPNYKNTFVFDNDFASLLSDTPSESMDEQGLFVAQSEKGICRVICFSPKHNQTIAQMETVDVTKVVQVWMEQFLSLGANELINYVQIFENRGEVMGCSNPHPHGQIWANQTIPTLVEKECAKQLEYNNKTGGILLLDYLNHELQKAERIIFQNEHFVALVPFWAVWPFETMILPREHVSAISDLQEPQISALADIMRRMSVRFDNLFSTSFPYSMGLHQRPTDGCSHAEWQFHIHYYPPLLRSATVKKFMVGYEMLASPQRDIPAEESARRLRDCSEIHYTNQS